MEAILRNHLTLSVWSLLAVLAFVIGSPMFVIAQEPAQEPAPAHKMAAAVPSVDIPIPDIKYTKFVLNNGLTVLVHEDHKAPIVAVNTWYHVGSKNEKPGKTGFAHLFEHLMFSGSDNFNHTLHQCHGEGWRHQSERHHE